MKKKFLILTLVLLMVLSSLAACSSNDDGDDIGDNGNGDGDPIRVALISNQRSGDMGPVDSMFEGAKRAEQDLGIVVKTLESEDAAAYEEDIRAMAAEGYDMIITTFQPMTEATKAVAADYPEIKFTAIFQNINDEDVPMDNVWDTEYRGEECTYILGVISATLTETNKIGYVSGNEAAAVREACNGFMRGVRDTNPDASVEFISVGSFEDPARAKEIAAAMAAKGIDVIQTDAGSSQLGVIEAAKELGIYVSGDVSDNYDLCPEGFFSYMGINFGENVYLACKYFVEGNFPGGEHGFMNIASGTYFVDFDLLDTLAEAVPDKADKIMAAKEAGQEAQSRIENGELIVEYDIEAPDWNRIKNEVQ